MSPKTRKASFFSQASPLREKTFKLQEVDDEFDKNETPKSD